MNQKLLSIALLLALSGCNGSDEKSAAPQASAAETSVSAPAQASTGSGFATQVLAQFDEPWAMSFLPNGDLLVTEKRGAIKRMDSTGKIGTISGAPTVDYGGQGGLGDILPHPRITENGWVYLSYAEAGDGDLRGAAVARAQLTLDDVGGGALGELQVIWRQVPKMSGRGHYGHRLAFDRDGMLWISSGDRQKFDPAQDLASNLGKTIRLHDDGSVPQDNPFADQGGVAAQVWSLGHRNPLGLAFNAEGVLWMHEMGPAGGDELNLIERASNYGWPMVSNGEHYDGKDIPDHPTRPEFNAPEVSWTPVIAPAGFIIYSGTQFPQWQGNGFIGGLASQALVRIEFDGTTAREAERFDMGHRIRDVEQGPDGAIWLLEDGSDARLLRLDAGS